MNIEFSRHAIAQLKIRTRITKSMVIKTIKQPDHVTIFYRDRMLYKKGYGKDRRKDRIVDT